MEYVKRFTNRQYNDNDVQTALLTRLEELRQQSPEYFSKPIHVLDAVDDTIEGQLERRLQQEKRSCAGKRITLIPYNIGNSHWIGLLLEFTTDEQIIRAEYIDPVNGDNIIPTRVKNQFARVYVDDVLQIRHLRKQDGPRNSAELMIENLLVAAGNASLPREAGNELTISELRQRLNSGLVKWEIQDVTNLPEKIQETEQRIADYWRKKRSDKVEREKAKMKELKQLVELSKKMAFLLSSMNDDELKLHYMEQRLVSGLAKWEIQNVSKLPEKIWETEQRIADYLRRKRYDKAERAKTDLTELIDLVQLKENISSFQILILSKEAKLKEDLKILHEALPIMPTCAEKTIMELQEHFQRKLLKDCVLPLTKNSPNDLLKQLDNQMKRQELISGEIRVNLQELDTFVHRDDCFSTVRILKELLKKIWPLNIHEIRMLAGKGKETVELIRGKDIILLVGATGSGKSTTIQFLAGTRMKETKVEISPGKYSVHIEPVGPIKNPRLSNVTNSPLNKSDTHYIVPITVPLKDIFGLHETGYIILCDTPDFGDTADAEVDLANSVVFIEAITGCSSVKLLVLSNYQSLDDRGQGIQKLAHLLSNIVNKIDYRLNTILYAFTKCPLPVDINALLLDIKASTVDRNLLLKSDSAFVTLLEDMIEKTKNNAEIIDPVHGDPRQLIEKLKLVNSIQYPGDYFRFSMSEETQTVIVNQVHRYKLNIMCAMKYRDNNLVIYYLNDLKTFKDWLKQNFIRDAYQDSLRFVKDSIANCYAEMMQNFNRSFTRQDKLREEDITDYIAFIDYIEDTQKLNEHLGSDLMSSTTVMQNIDCELQKISHALITEDLNSPLVKAFLDNFCLLKSSLKLLESSYNASCKKFSESFERLLESARELMLTNEFVHVARIILIISESSQTLNSHLGRQIEQKYRETVKLLLKHLISFSDKADALLAKPHLNDSDVKKLRNYMEILKSAKENNALQDRISTYVEMLGNKTDVYEDNFQDLNEIYNKFISNIVVYFENISIRIQELFKENEDRALENIEQIVAEMEAIHALPELESKTAGTYYRTIENIRKYMQQLQREVQKSFVAIDSQSENINYRYLANSVARLKNAKWIDRLSPGTHDLLMCRIREELMQYADQLEHRLMKLDLSLKYHENVIVAQDILKRIESLSIFESSVPELEKGRLRLFKYFLKSMQGAFDCIQRTFNLQDSTVYQIKQELKELEQIKRDYEDLDPAHVYSRKQESPNIDSLNRKIESLKTKQKPELVNQDRSAGFSHSLNQIDTMKRQHEWLSGSCISVLSEEITFLQKKGFPSIESLYVSIQEKKRIILEREKNKPPYDFSGRFDASIANSALVYLSQCEKGYHVRVKEIAFDTNEILKKYIREYGNFLNQEITRNFKSIINIESREDYSEYSNDLEKYLRELSSLNRFANVFDCIDGAEKQENWYQTFFGYHRNLSDKMEEYKMSDNKRELQTRLNIAQALICVDSFCASVFTDNGFRVLYRQYQIEVNKQCKATYMSVLDHISKMDYESATISLADIDHRLLNEKDLAQIKHDLQTSLYKLMTDIKSIVHSLFDKIEREEDSRSQIQEIKEKIEKIQIATNKKNIMQLLDNKIRIKLDTFSDDIEKNLTDIILRGFDAIEVLISTDNFSEAEQCMKNLGLVQRELAAYCTSTTVTEKSKELRDRLDNMVNEILQRDFEDISKYSMNSPKDLIEKLKMAALHGNIRFNQTCNIISEKIRESFSAAIDQVRAASLEERASKIRSLNYALCFLPDELQASFKFLIDELSKSVTDEEKALRRELNESLKSVDDDDHAIGKLGTLAQRYSKQNANELFETLRTEILKKMYIYRENVTSVLDRQDMQSAINIVKKILKYKESVGSHIPEVEAVYKNVRDLIIKNFLNCCDTLVKISTIEQTHIVEEAFHNMIICISFSTTFHEKNEHFLPEHVLENGSDSFLKMYEYLYQNSEKYRRAIDGLHIVELGEVLRIAKRWDGLLQKIKQCHLKHESIQVLVKNIMNVIPYTNMIAELQKKISYLRDQLDVELISNDTTKFENKREEFFGNLMKVVSTLKEIDSKLKDILPFKVEVDKVEDELKKKIQKLGDHLLAIASKGELSTHDSDQFRMFYNHLASLNKYAARIGFDVRQFLDSSDKRILDQVMSLSKEIRSSSSDVTKVAKLLTQMKFFAENLSMFDSKINAEIDEALKLYKQREGASVLMQLTMILEKTDIGARLMSEHSALSGEDWRKRREKMQNQDNLEYVLKELTGDDIVTDVLATCYQIFRAKYDDLVSRILAVFDQRKDNEPDLEVLITQTKALVAKVTRKPNTIIWDYSFKDKIPELLAYIFAVWTLKNTQHYNALRGIESARAYLLMPHVAQVLAIFRILGIGYKKYAKTSDDLINNLVEIGTGEGKSVVMAVTACVFALIGVDVNCSCYSEVLSTRDKNDFASVFKALGVEERIEYGTFNKLCENLLNERCNVREKVRDMIVNNRSAISVVGTNAYLRPKVLLIDEVDVFLSDKFYGGMYTPSVYLRDSSIKELLDTIWQNKTVRNSDSIKATSAYKTCAARFSNWTFILDEAIKDMIAALESFQSSTHIVQNDKIVYVEGESIVENVVRGYDTVWTYYQEKQNGNISQSSLEENVGILVNCGTFSYAEMPHEFAYITGVTGTLRTLVKTETDILKYVYNVQKNTFMPSVFGKSNRTYNPSNDVQVMSESEYFMRIRGEIDGVCKADRAILVFFESEEKLMKFYESPELVSKKHDVQIITETVSVKDRELYIKRAAMIGRITLLTRTFGRGTDFICRNQQLLLNGGMHVLQTFFSEELSEEYQIIGRGARQGDYGSYRMILLDKDLEWVLGSTWKEELPNIAGTILYKTLNKARHALYKSKCAAKELGIEQCKLEHKAAKEFMTALSEGNIKAVKKFLLKQNRGASSVTKTSRTVLLMDATGSMSSLLSAAKETVCTMFERASDILKEEMLPSDAFQMQIAIYRNYNSRENKILQASSWETKASNLRSFMNTISPEGGWGPEAIEIGLWHAVKESEMQNSISQIILIGDAPANTQQDVRQKRESFGEAYWEKTRFSKPTYCRYELQKLKEKNIPVHSFYLTDYAKDDFEKIARETRGRCEHLDIHSADGAESLTDFVTEEILRSAAGDHGDTVVELYRTKYVRKTYAF
ncbi:unnamed protein product [Rotaria magnacalcarata]|uniref:SecA family profile domain-containing protein n=1 Tax=Rotaria magnacalcarata TaxID=392030 RepID=A0A816BLJ8_9BILA|nr:unnamed protein product [Rotaria magnacalcarata]